MTKLNFKSIAADALLDAGRIVTELLPNGKRQGDEWVALNPTRADRNLGSFKINLRSGQWAEFAQSYRQAGGDLISLVAYTKRVSQAEAARCLLKMMGRKRDGN